MQPFSTKVLKIIEWNSRTRQFELLPTDEVELKDKHIPQEQWEMFVNMYKLFPADQHPSIKRHRILLASVLSTTAIIVLLALLYCLWILFQLALYNLVMGVVMAQVWTSICGVTYNVIYKFLDGKRKSGYRAYFRDERAKEWVKKLQIDI